MVVLDGQDVTAAAPGAGPRPVALLRPSPPEGSRTVLEVLRAAAPDAPPEALAHAWWRAGVALPLAEGLRRSVAGLEESDRWRVGLAADRVGDPAVLVVDTEALAAAPAAVRGAVERVAARHRGAVLVVRPAPVGANTPERAGAPPGAGPVRPRR